LPDSFAHSRDANADPRQCQDSAVHIAGNPVTLIADLHRDFVGMARDPNRRCPAAGMTMDVGEAFLHDPKTIRTSDVPGGGNVRNVGPRSPIDTRSMSMGISPAKMALRQYWVAVGRML